MRRRSPRLFLPLVFFLFASFAGVGAQDVIDLVDGSSVVGTVRGLHDEGVLIETASGARIAPWKNIGRPGLTTSSALTVTMDNGDRLSGRAVGFDGTHVTLVSPYLAELRLPISGFGPIPPPEEEAAIPDKADIPAKKTGILEEEDWNGSVALLGTLRSGNVNSTLFEINARIARQWSADRFTAQAGLAYGETEGEKTASHARAGAKWDHFYNEDFYSYATGDVEYDEIKNLDLRAVLGIGFGLAVWRGEKDHQSFDVEGGITGIYQKFKGESSDLDLAGRFAFVYKNVFFEKLLFTEEFEFLFPFADLARYILRSRTLVELQISEHWYFQNQLTIEYQGDPPGGNKNLDLRLLVGLEYKF